jgi:phenylacetate-CoA ligase
MRAMLFDNDSLPVMFEPDAEAMSAERLRALQARRLSALIDRLLAAGGLQADRLADTGVTSGAEPG